MILQWFICRWCDHNISFHIKLLTCISPTIVNQFLPPVSPSVPLLISPPVPRYAYTAQSKDELSFQAGDRIDVVDFEDNGTGWGQGRLNGMLGHFPGNYVERC